MPGKHVHFSKPVKRVTFDVAPSPASSISSLPSSAGPITPPSWPVVLPPVRRHSHHHHAYPPPPPAKPPPAQLHPMLVVSKPRAVNFDMTLHPSFVSTSYASLSSRPGLLSEPAISPPVSHMTLHVPSSTWRIDVRPKLNGAYITVSDVLHALYNGLRENVRKEEFYSLPGKDAMKHVTAAYERRYKRVKGSRAAEDERKAGVKRIDFLLDRVWFAGLTPVTNNSWLIHLL